MKNIDTLESILERFRDETGRYIVDSIFLRQALNLYIEDRERLARINSLLDLEQWIKLNDLQQDMILDGIEHMVKSNLQVPDQPRLDHTDRIKELEQ